jgi:Transglutaminase-like superfamily
VSTGKLHRIAHLIGRARAQSVADWRYLAIAVKELLLARAAHAVRPAGRIIETLQARNSVSGAAVTAAPNTLELTRRSRAILTAASLVPWRADCLPQAMAADRWLRRDGLRPEFHIGVAKDAGGLLQAHAWLTCGGVTVTGGDASAFATFPGRP